jgi:hypothetical protein
MKINISLILWFEMRYFLDKIGKVIIRSDQGRPQLLALWMAAQTLCPPGGCPHFMPYSRLPTLYTL